MSAEDGSHRTTRPFATRLIKFSWHVRFVVIFFFTTIFVSIINLPPELSKVQTYTKLIEEISKPASVITYIQSATIAFVFALISEIIIYFSSILQSKPFEIITSLPNISSRFEIISQDVESQIKVFEAIKEEVKTTSVELKNASVILERLVLDSRVMATEITLQQKIQPLIDFSKSNLDPEFKKLILEKTISKLFSAPNYSYATYLDLLIQGNNSSKKWRGMHVGNVDALFGEVLEPETNTHMRRYLESLNKIEDKKRIVISSEGPGDWLRNKEKVNRFKELTGNSVDSYKIRKTVADRLLSDSHIQFNWTHREDTAIYNDAIAIRFLPNNDAMSNEIGTIHIELYSDSYYESGELPKAMSCLFVELEREISLGQFVKFDKI